MITITDEAIEQVRRMQGEIERLKGMVEILRVQRDELISQLGKAHACLRQIIEADDEFRMTLPDDWEGDPISDAVAAAKYLLSDD